jgi:2,3-dihydroxybenzoate-AMP ligase
MLEGCTPWPEEYARRYREEGYWEGITLVEMLNRSASKQPDKLAVVDGQKRVTYRDLVETSDRLAVRLDALGLKPLDRVVFQLGNSVELVYALFALFRLGVIPIFALPAHRQSEIQHFVSFSGAKAYLIPDRLRSFDFRPMAESVRAACPTLRHVIVHGETLEGQVSLSAMLEAGASAEEVSALKARAPEDPGEVALMLLSGGTTGLPKLIPRTHNDYVYNCKQSGKVMGFGDSSVYLAVLPMAHNWTLASPGILATLAYGGTVVIAPDIQAETIFPLIERERVTIVAAAVPLVVNWLQSEWPEKSDLSSLKLFMNGGAKLVPELRRQIEKRFGCTFAESFGTGEGLLNKTRPGDPDHIRFESSGSPVSPADEIKVVDDMGRELPDGEVGELLVRGPYTIRGYYNAPDATAKAFTEDGFYRMGDAVKKNGRYLYVEGRKKDLINRGGEKISCEEVENHLIAHPAVRNVCLVAMPDPVYGEKGCAFVILKPGETLSFDEMKSFLASREIAKFKWPERLEIVDAFPISPAGKVLRRELRERIAEALAAEKTKAAV